MDLFSPRHLILLFVLFMLGAFYFLPTVIAFVRQHRNKVPILLVNFFFGWTVLGWIGCLIWSVTSQKPQTVTVINAGPQQ
jgi:hypothetical protein